MDSAIQPLNNQGLVDSVTNLLNTWGQVNKIKGSTLKVSPLHVKILLVLKSVLRTLADSRIGQVLCTKIIQHLSGLLIFHTVTDPRNSGISAKSHEIPKKT